MTAPVSGAGAAAGGPGYVPPSEGLPAAPIPKQPVRKIFPPLPNVLAGRIFSYLTPVDQSVVACTKRGFPHVVRQMAVPAEVKKMRAFVKLIADTVPEASALLTRAFKDFGLDPIAHTKVGYYKEVNAELSLILDGLPLEKVRAICRGVSQSDIPSELKILLDIHHYCRMDPLPQTQQHLFATFLASNGLSNLALELVKDVHDGYFQSLLLEEIAKYPMNPEQIDLALELASSIVRDDHLAHALKALVEHPMTSKQAKRTHKLANTMTNFYFQVRTIRHLVNKLYSSARIDDALSIVASILDVYDKSLLLSQAITHLATDEHIEGALKIAESFTDSMPKSRLLRMLALHCAESERIDKALSIAASIPLAIDKWEVLRVMIKDLTTPEQFTQARLIAESITLSSCRAKALAAIAASQKGEEV